MESAFEDTEPYVLTELGSQFVHYVNDSTGGAFESGVCQRGRMSLRDSRQARFNLIALVAPRAVRVGAVSTFSLVLFSQFRAVLAQIARVPLGRSGMNRTYHAIAATIALHFVMFLNTLPTYETG